MPAPLGNTNAAKDPEVVVKDKLDLRIRAADKEIIKQRAEDAGMSLSDYIRNLGLGLIQPAPPTTTPEK